MRWLVVAPGPGFSVYDVHVGWMEGLRALGEQVIEFPLGDVMTWHAAVHLDREDGQGLRPALTPDEVSQFSTDRVAAALFKVRPHVLLIVSGFFTDPQVLAAARHYGTKVVLIHTESPYEDERQLRIAPLADLNLINDPVQLARFEAVAPTVYAPHAYRTSIHRPGPAVPDLVCDLGFVGTGYPSRVAFFEETGLLAGAPVDVKLGGNWMRLPEHHPLRDRVVHPIDECMDNEDAVPLYRSARVGLNLYRREAETEDCPNGVAIGPREVEMAACGMFFVRDPRPEGDEVFHMLPAFDSPAEAGELVRWWARHDEPRQKLAQLAREAIAERTFTQHARQLLRLLGVQ